MRAKKEKAKKLKGIFHEMHSHELHKFAGPFREFRGPRQCNAGISTHIFNDSALPAQTLVFSVSDYSKEVVCKFHEIVKVGGQQQLVWCAKKTTLHL